MKIINLTDQAKILKRGFNLSMIKFLQKYDEFGYPKYDIKSAVEYLKENKIKINFYDIYKSRIKIGLIFPSGKSESYSGVSWGHIIGMVHAEITEPELIY